MRFLLRLVFLFGLAIPATAGAAAPTGRWLTEGGDGVVQIGPCGDALCGWLVGFPHLPPAEPPPRDVRGESQCRLAIITGAQQVEPNLWRGRVTNPEDGRTYGVELSLDPQGRLRLRGFLLVPLLGSTQIWTPFRGRLTEDCRVG